MIRRLDTGFGTDPGRGYADTSRTRPKHVLDPKNRYTNHLKPGEREEGRRRGRLQLRGYDGRRWGCPLDVGVLLNTNPWSAQPGLMQISWVLILSCKDFATDDTLYADATSFLLHAAHDIPVRLCVLFSIVHEVP